MLESGSSFPCILARFLTLQQKILSTSHSSFSVLGVALLLIIGTMIIAVENSLEIIITWLYKRFNLGGHRRVEWCINHTLQLQRLAHEELGFGTWSRTSKQNPITTPNELLAVIDVANPAHPALKIPDQIEEVHVIVEQPKD